MTTAHRVVIEEVKGPSGARPGLTVSFGWRAECRDCGWHGLTWSIPCRDSARASYAMAHLDEHDHLKVTA